MDTELLSAFLAVADAASFSLAAERLHLTQPAISKRIAALEEQLGVRLFDRIGRHVSLTERWATPAAARAAHPARDRGHRARDPRPLRQRQRPAHASPPATTSGCTACRRCCAPSRAATR
jgi:hypothetical protein